MTIPHSGAGSARRKSGPSLEFPCGAAQRAAEVIVGVAVAAWKTGAAHAHNRGDVGSGDFLAEEFLGDPFIDDAPIRLWEARANPETVHPIGIDLSGNRGRGTRISIEASQHWQKQR